LPFLALPCPSLPFLVLPFPSLPSHPPPSSLSLSLFLSLFSLYSSPTTLCACNFPTFQSRVRIHRIRDKKVSNGCDRACEWLQVRQEPR
jgi:hypothetical protein